MQPLFISKANIELSNLVLPDIRENTGKLLKSFHIHYNNALSFYRTDFFKNTHHTIGCLAITENTKHCNKFITLDYSKIPFIQNTIYVIDDEYTRMNMMYNFYCDYSTLLKLTSCYKYFIDFCINTKVKFEDQRFANYLMEYILSINTRIMIINE